MEDWNISFDKKLSHVAIANIKKKTRKKELNGNNHPN